MKRSNPIIDVVFIFSCSLFFFFTFLGNIHLFDWDEINFAECAREMLVSKDFLHVTIDFKPFHEKPPLFIWMQALSMMVFGVNEYAARFPNAVCGLITLLTLYRIGIQYRSRGFALAWVLAYMGSLLPHFYFKSGIIDPWFNYFIFVALYFIYRFLEDQKQKHIVYAGLLSGLAVFTKGPVAYLLIGLTVFIYFLWQLKHKQWSLSFGKTIQAVLIFTILSFLFISSWYAYDIIQNGPALFNDFIQYQLRLMNTEDAGHGGFPGYHVVVLLLGVFPASFYMLYLFLRHKQIPFLVTTLSRILFILFWVVLVVFSLVKSKIVHYSSLCYFPITFFAAYAILHIIKNKLAIPKSIQIAILCVHLLLGLLLSVAPFIPLKQIQPFLAKDPFAQANLDAVIQWQPFSYTLAIVYTIAVLVFYVYSNRIHRSRLVFAGHFMFTILYLHLFFWFYLANVETITQRAAISFFKSIKGKDVYVGVHGYKSYALYFYAQTPRDTVFITKDRAQTLVHDTYNKPVYLVAKIKPENNLPNHGFIEVGRYNGFIFYEKPVIPKAVN